MHVTGDESAPTARRDPTLFCGRSWAPRRVAFVVVEEHGKALQISISPGGLISRRAMSRSSSVWPEPPASDHGEQSDGVAGPT